MWRRIRLHPGHGWIGGALEDDLHRFHLRVDHEGGWITRVGATALRHPWSACPGAAPFIQQDLTGEPLSEVAQRDPKQHCTHLLDLAILCAAHADDAGPTTFDMRVADRAEGRTTATLEQDGVERLRWRLDGTVIAEPAPFAGLELRRLSQWKKELPAHEAEWATLLRRAIFISGGRIFVPPESKRAVEMGPQRMGVCFNYQLPQAERSTPNPDWRRDFSKSGAEPLEHFDPQSAFAELAG